MSIQIKREDKSPNTITYTVEADKKIFFEPKFYFFLFHCCNQMKQKCNKSSTKMRDFLAN